MVDGLLFRHPGRKHQQINRRMVEPPQFDLARPSRADSGVDEDRQYQQQTDSAQPELHIADRRRFGRHQRCQ
jgi:hypothetical protein